MIVVTGRAGSVDGLRLVRLVVEEVEVGSLLVWSGVGDGDADHGAGEFAKKKASFLREERGNLQPERRLLLIAGESLRARH